MLENIYGNIRGMKKADLELLQNIYSMSINKDEVISLEAAGVVANISSQIKRELAVFINRQGRVVSVGVGDTATVQLEAPNQRRGDFGLSGLRCIHTHPSGSGSLSQVDYAALIDMRLDAMVALGVQGGRVKEACLACLDPGTADETGKVQGHMTFGPMSPDKLVAFPLLPLILKIEAGIKRPGSHSTEQSQQGERAILISIESQDALNELEQLAETAGAVTVGRLVQKRDRPHSASFIGRGKVQELSLLRQQLSASLAIFDDELSPTQIRNLTSAAGCRIIDRTALILDIFSQRAHTREGKLQVELAQLRYLLPRLTGQGTALSRLGGGIGTRGPGETKLETDRRHIRRRIEELDRALEDVRQQRQSHRLKRQESNTPVAALVGYTNAGKSTLLNALTNSEVFTADKLFATLDPTTRRLQLPQGQEILLTDTVGFIRKLPHHLVAAFRATLEEVLEADLLLHVVDASSPQFQEQISSVEDVLKELGALNKKTIIVFNKMDRLANREALEEFKISSPTQMMEVSSVTAQGLEELRTLLAQNTGTDRHIFRGLLPFDRADLISLVHRQGLVNSQRYTEKGIWLEAAVDKRIWSALVDSEI